MQTLRVETERRTQLVDVTAKVREATHGQSGLLVVIFVPHATAGIVLQASGYGATAVAADIERALERIVDESWSWEHTAEGDRNPWAHVRAALTSSSIAIPLDEGELAIGDLQTIFFRESGGPRTRRIHVTVA